MLYNRIIIQEQILKLLYRYFQIMAGPKTYYYFDVHSLGIFYTVLTQPTTLNVERTGIKMCPD